MALATGEQTSIMKTIDKADADLTVFSGTATRKAVYEKPHLASFGTLASVTGSNVTGSFLDTMTSMPNDTDMAPLVM